MGLIADVLGWIGAGVVAAIVSWLVFKEWEIVLFGGWLTLCALIGLQTSFFVFLGLFLSPLLALFIFGVVREAISSLKQSK